jgi:hypothetical protein
MLSQVIKIEVNGVELLGRLEETLPQWLKRFLMVPLNPSSIHEIVGWWEIRRIPYNLIIGGAGFVSLLLMLGFGSQVVAPGEDVIEPMALFFFGPLILIGANVCYTAGWVLESIPFKNYNGVIFPAYRWTFLAGILFSVGLLMVPGALWTLGYVIDLISKHVH